MKKIFSWMLVCVMLLSAVPFGSLIVSASDVLTFEIKGGKAVVTACDESASGTITVPDSYKGCPVSEIAEGAFGFCFEITKITLGKNLKTIGKGAFYACSRLQSISIPTGVSSIGEAAFGECLDLREIALPDKVTVIGDSTFYCCLSLKKVSLGSAVTKIGSYVFVDCNALSTLELPASLRTVGESALPTTDIKKIYYAGTTAQWKKVDVKVGEFDGDKGPGWLKKVVCVGNIKPKAKVANKTNGVNLTWSKVSGATGYRISRSRRSGGKWGAWSTVKTVKTCTYLDKTVKAGSQYRYAVRAVFSNIESGYTASTSIRRLKAPGSIRLTKATKGFKVTWSKVAGAQKYEVYRKVGTGSWKKVKTTAARSFVDRSAKKGRYYTYRVRAVHGSSESVYKTAKRTKR